MSKPTVPITIDKTLFNVHPKVRHFLIQQRETIEELRRVAKKACDSLEDAFQKGIEKGRKEFNMTEYLPPE